MEDMPIPMVFFLAFMAPCLAGGAVLLIVESVKSWRARYFDLALAAAIHALLAGGMSTLLGWGAGAGLGWWG